MRTPWEDYGDPAVTVAGCGTFTGNGKQLAQLILDQVITHPDTHDQANWVDEGSCGTTMCVAGWAHWFAVGQWDINHTGPGYMVRVGRQLLGLSKTDAVHLFFLSSNQQAVHALKAISNGERLDWETIGNARGENEATVASRVTDYLACLPD